IKVCVSGWPAAAYAVPEAYEMPDSILVPIVEEAHRLGRPVVAHDISLGGVRAAIRAGVDALAHAAYLDSAAAGELARKAVPVIATLASLTGQDTSIVSRALVSSTLAAYHGGVPIVFGTDAGVLKHGENAREFNALVNAGLSPIDAIRSAT